MYFITIFRTFEKIIIKYDDYRTEEEITNEIIKFNGTSAINEED